MSLNIECLNFLDTFESSYNLSIIGRYTPVVKIARALVNMIGTRLVLLFYFNKRVPDPPTIRRLFLIL